MRWSGTPALIANVAREVESQVAAGDSGPKPFAIKVVAPAWESEFITPDDFQGGLPESDVADIDSVEIRSSTMGRAITVTFARPPKSQRNQSSRPAVSLNVAGPDRDWVTNATEAVTQAIQPGVPHSEAILRWVLLGSPRSWVPGSWLS
jgi:hypothetical protein